MNKSLKIVVSFIIFVFFTQILFSQVRRVGFEENKTSTIQSAETQSDLSLMNSVEYDALEKIVDPKLYILGAGDMLSINIISVESKYFIVSISPEGYVEIPYIGNIKIAELSLCDGKKEILSLLKKQFVNTEINVQLKKMREFKIHLTGAVEIPGLKSVKPTDRIVDIIQNSSGIMKLGKFNEIHITHSNGDEIVVNGYDYTNNGNLEANPFVQQGDLIFIPKADPFTETITVSGATKNKGIFPLIEGEKLSEFLNKYSNFSDNISTYSVNIIRKNEDKTKYYTIDVVGDDPKIEKKDIVLEPNDIIELSNKMEVYVQGKVNRPGTYRFVGGYKVIDYIGLAGGNTNQGNIEKALILRNGKKIKGLNNIVKRGDIIIIPRSSSDILIGEFNALGIISSIASLVLLYLSTQ